MSKLTRITVLALAVAGLLAPAASATDTNLGDGHRPPVLTPPGHAG